MTLQQLEYIRAIDHYRSFARAAESLDITQPTLSSALNKFEDEVGVKIFERSNKIVCPTEIGVKVIEQAKVVLQNAQHIMDIVQDEKGIISGRLRVCTSTNLAPVLTSQLLSDFNKKYPNVELTIQEASSSRMFEMLKNNELDLGVDLSGLNIEGIYEIPMNHEKCYLYISPQCKCRQKRNKPNIKDLDPANFILANNFFGGKRPNILNNVTSLHPFKIESVSLGTLLNLVDDYRAYTMLTSAQVAFLGDMIDKEYLIESDEAHGMYRDISIYINKDYVKESLLNAYIKVMLSHIPESEIDVRMRKFRGVKL